MKYYLVVPILAAFILAGCSKENSIVGPPSQQTQAKREWIKINTAATLAVENSYTASKSIEGSKGGTINLTQVYKSNGQWAIVTAKLSIPQGAFSGTKVISYTVNTDNASISFSPSPQSFQKNLSLDLTFTGVNLAGVDVSKLAFSYLDGSTIVPAKFTYVNANIAQGLLVVIGAQLSHFSMYGWSTLD
jgi:hypothetical protein